MILRLSDSLSRALVLFVVVLVGAWMSFFSVRAAVARYGAEGTTKRRLELATRWEPGNPVYWFGLARLNQYDLEHPNPESAEQLYRKAISLDPLYTDAWMDLGTNYELDGRDDEAHHAFQQAKKSYPSSADVSWRYGNFLLRQGNQQLAYAELKRAIAADPQRAAAAFTRAYRSNPNIDEILADLLPTDQTAYLGVIKEAAASKQFAVAQTVWGHLIALRPKLTFQDMDWLVMPLVQDREYQEARRVWDEGVATMKLPPLFQPQLSVIWDPSFESGNNGPGFAWDFRKIDQGVRISLDRGEKLSGEQSLQLSFDGKHNPDLEAACTIGSVQPGTNYHFSGWIKTKDITTANGIEFVIRPYGNTIAAVTSTREIHGTNPWTVFELTWTSPADAHAVRICIKREPSDDAAVRISGTAWVDDVDLVPQASGTHKP